MAKGDTISVVIPTYNRCELLKKNLAAVAAQTLDPSRIEVIVVNDGGTDDTDAMIESLDMPYRLKYVRIEHWTAIPYNVGAQNAENDFVLFLDDDVIPHPEMLGAHIETHNKLDGPTAVIGRLQWPAEKNLTPFESYVGWSGILMGTHLIKNPDNVHFKFALGGNFSVPRELFEKSGGYDISYLKGGYGHIDIEFGYTLQKKFGVNLLYSEKAAADHWYCAPFERFMQQREMAGATAVIFYTKYPEMSRYLKIDWVRRRGPWAWAVRNTLHCAYHTMRRAVPLLEKVHPRLRGTLYLCYRVCIFYHFQKGIKSYLAKVEKYGSDPFPDVFADQD